MAEEKINPLSVVKISILKTLSIFNIFDEIWQHDNVVVVDAKLKEYAQLHAEQEIRWDDYCLVRSVIVHVWAWTSADNNHRAASENATGDVVCLPCALVTANNSVVVNLPLIRMSNVAHCWCRYQTAAAGCRPRRVTQSQLICHTLPLKNWNSTCSYVYFTLLSRRFFASITGDGTEEYIRELHIRAWRTIFTEDGTPCTDVKFTCLM